MPSSPETHTIFGVGTEMALKSGAPGRLWETKWWTRKWTGHVSAGFCDSCGWAMKTEKAMVDSLAFHPECLRDWKNSLFEQKGRSPSKA